MQRTIKFGIANLPQITEIMIRSLPTFVGYNLEKKIEDYPAIRAGLKDIFKNIDIIATKKPDIALELSDKLAIQIAIMEHGYQGIGNNYNLIIS